MVGARTRLVLAIATSFIAGIIITGTVVAGPDPIPPPPGTDCTEIGPGADLQGCDLSGADLSGANLKGADLTNAILTDANLNKANLRDADLSAIEIIGGPFFMLR